MKTHPVQKSTNKLQGRVRTEVTLSAYEVYSHVYAPQEALITGNCRGGFSVGELIAFLYAKSFPKKEWNDRVREAFEEMQNI